MATVVSPRRKSESVYAINFHASHEKLTSCVGLRNSYSTCHKYFYRGPSTLAGLAIICVMIPVTKSVAKVRTLTVLFINNVAISPWFEIDSLLAEPQSLAFTG